MDFRRPIPRMFSTSTSLSFLGIFNQRILDLLRIFFFSIGEPVTIYGFATSCSAHVQCGYFTQTIREISMFCDLDLTLSDKI